MVCKLDQNHAISQIQSRLLYPFSVSRRSVDKLAVALEHAELNKRSLWQRFDYKTVPIDAYRADHDTRLLQSIFGDQDRGQYFRLNPAVANTIFSRDLTVSTHKELDSFPIQLVYQPTAEIVLSPYGVGLCSIALELDLRKWGAQGDHGANSPCESAALQFNYRLSQLRPWSVARFRSLHPEDDFQRWGRIPHRHRIKIADKPADDAPIEKRLTTLGGNYTLEELFGYFVAPLTNDEFFEPTQEQCSVYTVLRYPHPTDFSDPPTQTRVSRVLSALAQVERETHPDALPGKPSVAHEFINRNHSIGVSCLATAHLVSDQSEDIEFNNSRIQHIRDHHYIPYLTAYLQKLVLLRFNGAIANSVRASGTDFDTCAPDFRRVLQDLIEFNAVLLTPEVATKESINRTYRLCQNGLQVDRAWSVATQNTMALDAACRTVRQESIQQQSAKSIRKQEEAVTQSEAHLSQQKAILNGSRELLAKVEWVEIFLIAVYVAEMFHILGGSMGFNHQYVGWAVLAGSALAITVSMLILRPWHSLRLKGASIAIAIAVLGVGTFLAIGRAYFTKHESHNSVYETQQPESNEH